MIAGNTKSGNEFSKAVANSLIKMSVNETKHLRIPARLCFGDRDPKKIFKLTLNSSNAHYRVGDEIKIKVSEQEQTRVLEGTITKIDGDHAHVDTNHPLAGENLVVKVQIVSFC
jgi:FKBP-type peptidyl-prolyl cis-trans isomerase 2